MSDFFRVCQLELPKWSINAPLLRNPLIACEVWFRCGNSRAAELLPSAVLVRTCDGAQLMKNSQINVLPVLYGVR